MNNKILNKYIFGAMLLSLAACTQDELADSGNTLPTGKYPLEIASVTMDVTHSQQPWSADTPQTRVSESDDRNSSVWDGGESIGMRIASNGNETAVYTLQSDKTTLQPADKPLYWKNTTASKVCAWFPADGKVDLNNQTKENGLAYALYAETTNAVDYNTQDITLPFEHKLAKVRVVLKGNQANQANEIKIKTYTSCTLNTDGTLTAGDAEDYISMVQTTYNSGVICWEANVVPDKKIEQFQVNGVEGTLNNGGIIPVKAKVNTITINVGKAAINPDDLPEEINSNEEYTISGTGTKGITIIGGSPTIRFRDVTLESGTAIEIKGGSPKLVFEGTASLESTAEGKGAISLSGGASVEISGGGTLSLKANTADIFGDGWIEGAILGSAGGEQCGNISISGVTLDIEANLHNAAIGSGEYNSSCGNIIITDATIRITSCKGGAGIGTSRANAGTSSCGDIRIKNSDIEIEYGNMSAFQGAAIGCAAGGSSGSGSADYPNTVKGIYITLKSGQSQSDFFGKLTTTSATGSDKVGYGYNESDNQKYGTITDGIHWYDAGGTEIK